MATPSRAEVPLKQPYTAEQFYRTNDWGQKAGYTLTECQFIWQKVEGRHVNLPGHNFPHGVDVLIRFNLLADAYDERFPEHPIDRKIGNLICLCHDAAEDEAASAAFGAELAQSLGFTPKQVEQVELGILSTAEAVQPGTDLEILVSVADLYNLSNPERAEVQKRTLDFMAEARQKQGSAFSEMGFRKSNLERLVNFASKDLSIPGFKLQAVEQIRQTIRLMISEFARDRHEEVSNVLRELGSAAVALFNGGPDSESHDPKDQAAS